MKLFVDAHVLDDLSQGSKTYLSGLYNAACEIDHQTDFFIATNTSASFQREVAPQLNVRHLVYGSSNKVWRLGLEIPHMIRNHKMDWAHFQYISPAIKRCKEIVTIHDLLFLDYPEYFPLDYRLLKNFLFKRSAVRAEWVLTVSEYSKQAISNHYHIEPERIIITPNGILEQYWEDEGSNEIPNSFSGLKQFILYVSRIEPRKNQVGLLKSYLDLGLWKQGIQLVFVGGHGISTPSFTQLLNSLGEKIRESIYVFENLPLKDLKWMYKNCSLFVYPSFAEGFGIPPLEALACGANVICSSTTAMSEFQFLGDRLFDPNNRDEMVQKIEFFLKRPEPQGLGETKTYLKAKYSWAESANRLLKLIR